MNLYKFYKNTFTITFIFEVFCIFSIGIYLLFFIFLGGAKLFGTETNILLVLISLGISCLITLVGIGFFMRIRKRFSKLLGSEKNFPSETLAEKFVLGIWIAAICFFSAAVYYGLYLIYQYGVYPVYGNAIGIFIVFIILGLLIICLILQGLLFIIAKFTKKVIHEILSD